MARLAARGAQHAASLTEATPLADSGGRERPVSQGLEGANNVRERKVLSLEKMTKQKYESHSCNEILNAE